MTPLHQLRHWHHEEWGVEKEVPLVPWKPVARAFLYTEISWPGNSISWRQHFSIDTPGMCYLWAYLNQATLVSDCCVWWKQRMVVEFSTLLLKPPTDTFPQSRASTAKLNYKKNFFIDIPLKCTVWSMKRMWVCQIYSQWEYVHWRSLWKFLEGPPGHLRTARGPV